jgi:formylmethanofuran dehydrogenase subunit A
MKMHVYESDILNEIQLIEPIDPEMYNIELPYEFVQRFKEAEEELRMLKKQLHIHCLQLGGTLDGKKVGVK